MRSLLDRYASLFKRWNFMTGQTNFVKGTAPRGGWPIRPFSRSKYRPMNDGPWSNESQRRRISIERGILKPN